MILLIPKTASVSNLSYPVENADPKMATAAVDIIDNKLVSAIRDARQR